MLGKKKLFFIFVILAIVLASILFGFVLSSKGCSGDNCTSDKGDATGSSVSKIKVCEEHPNSTECDDAVVKAIEEKYGTNTGTGTRIEFGRENGRVVGVRVSGVVKTMPNDLSDDAGSLRELTYLGNLKSFLVSTQGDSFTVPPINSLQRLKISYASGRVVISSLPNLEELVIFDNPNLKQVIFPKEFPHLKFIYIKRNFQLSSIKLPLVPEAEEITVHGNALREIVFSSNEAPSNLKNCDLNNNYLSKWPDIDFCEMQYQTCDPDDGYCVVGCGRELDC